MRDFFSSQEFTTFFDAQTAQIDLTKETANSALQKIDRTVFDVLVGNQPTIQVSSTTLAVTASHSQGSVTVSNTGMAGSGLNADVKTGGAIASHIQTSMGVLHLASGVSTTLIISATPAGLSAGTYTGTVTIQDPQATNNPVTINVTLTVGQ